MAHNDLLLSPNNYFEKAPTNNKGFDIWEKDIKGNVLRYIEVKTLTGIWGKGGVGVTINQLEFALMHREQWWLFVVKGINTDDTEVIQFKNPVIEATSFMFDDSWRQLAYIPENKNDNIKLANIIPEVGSLYSVSIEGEVKIYEITKVKYGGKLMLVWGKEEGGVDESRVLFDNTWKKI